MSAITGIYYLNGQSVDPKNLGQMVDILAHRGPDGSNIWNEGPIGLGHRMLWTTPESLLEKLPLVNQSGELVITADARIDNRDELIAALNLVNQPVEKITDSQLILAAYEKWGEDCPEHLLGDFAFSIWDGRKQVLFCVRDHFGVKPFYYYSSEQAFIFATEIKALFCLPDVPHLLNEMKVAEHLASVCYDSAITFYKNILRLPPAHRMTVSCEGIQLQPYWSLDPSRELRLGSDEEYAEMFREIFTEAVRCRLRSAFPVGSKLSGGLDSSSITCVARNLLKLEKRGSKLPTFSTIHEDVTRCDERVFQNAVLAQGGLEPYRLNLDRVSPLVDLDRVLWHQDELQGLSNFYANWSLYDSAKEQGIRVLLDGFDGDTTVSHGRGYLLELARAGRWLILANEVIAFSKKVNKPWAGALWAWVRLYGLNPMISRIPIIRLIVRISSALVRRAFRWSNSSTNNARPWGAILNAEFLQRSGLAARHEARPSQANTERENHYRLLTDPGEQNSLEKLDSAAGAFSIETRFPFWDKRLVEFCLSLPPQQKLNQGWSRIVLRRAMAGILPDQVQWRERKTDHRFSFEHTLLTFERERLEETILKNPEVIEPYVDVNILRDEYHRFIAREEREADTVAIWKVLSLALWLKQTGLKL
ncbi:MAG: lasso peptide isopeptide bond-forming cyclase [Chamaesiphon sp.]